MLVEFGSAVDAARCAVLTQQGMVKRNEGVPSDQRIELRIGIHIGDIIIEEGDIFGDGVNIAARLEGIAQPGGISISEDAWRQVQGKVTANFVDTGEQSLKNIPRPVRVYRLKARWRGAPLQPAAAPLPSPEQPSIAVLPFQNMSGDPEQEHFCDGLVEDIITTLSKLAGLRVIARNSSFVYKGRSVDVREAAKQLGVRYLLEGSVRKSGNRIRITGAADRRQGRHARLGGALRPLDRGYFRHPGRNHAHPGNRNAGQAYRGRAGAAALHDDQQCRGLDLLGTRPVLLPPGDHQREPWLLRGCVGKRRLRSIPRQRCSTPCSASFTSWTPASAGGTIAKRQSSRREHTPTVRLSSIRTTPTLTLPRLYYVCGGALRRGRVPCQKSRPTGARRGRYSGASRLHSRAVRISRGGLGPGAKIDRAEPEPSGRCISAFSAMRAACRDILTKRLPPSKPITLAVPALASSIL